MQLYTINILQSSLFKDMVEKVMRGLGSITEYYPILLYQLIAIFLLAVVIKVFFLKKINKYLDDQRYKMIQQKLIVEKDRNEAFKYKEKQKQLYNKFKEENRFLREQVKNQALLEAEKIKDEAKLQAKIKLATVEQEIQQQYLEQEENIKKAIVEISYFACEKILKKELDHNEYDQVIEQVTNQMLEKKTK